VLGATTGVHCSCWGARGVLVTTTGVHGECWGARAGSAGSYYWGAL
jgi:hypothetical protein